MLSQVLQQVGKVSEAQAIYESVIEGRTEQLGPNHADTLMAQMNLAILHKEQGDFEQARQVGGLTCGALGLACMVVFALCRRHAG